MEKPNYICNILCIKCLPRCNVTNPKFKNGKNQFEYVNLMKKKKKQPEKKHHWTKRQPCTYTKLCTRSLNILQLIDIHIYNELKNLLNS